MLWADYLELSPRWALRLKMCRALTEATNKAGGGVKNVVLLEIRMRGNSHMPMQDRNSLEIADSNASSSPLGV